MLIITIRTDKPEAELGLYEDSKKVTSLSWAAHRELSDTIHLKLAELLKNANKDWPDIEGLVCYQGPGSFTGLRIGLTVANTLAYSYGAKIVGETGNDWQSKGITKLLDGQNDGQIMPEYGAEAHITQPRK